MLINWKDGMRHEYPFAHWVFPKFIDGETIKLINREWPIEFEKKENGRYSKKYGTRQIPPAANNVIKSIRPEMVAKLFNIEKLIADPDLSGAGLHCIPPGGFLKMHVDFNAHPKYKWHRRVNLLLFLNQDWEEKWGGKLRLQDKANNPSSLLEWTPIAGRCVVFETNDQSWHGHPEPLTCPNNRQRRSIAIYFYSQDPPKEKHHTTIYSK